MRVIDDVGRHVAILSEVWPQYAHASMRVLRAAHASDVGPNRAGRGGGGKRARAAGLVLRVNARPQAAGGLGVPVEGVGQDGVTVQAAPKLRGVRGGTPGSVQMHCAHRLAQEGGAPSGPPSFAIVTLRQVAQGLARRRERSERPAVEVRNDAGQGLGAVQKEASHVLFRDVHVSSSLPGSLLNRGLVRPPLFLSLHGLHLT
mmetsp:Transcript_30056/g.75287  ORF Transcript_30056/g.75287 Transcript_30056/m.75287 type:complete len:202 (+) Transcript_30056:5279-5884(+)